MVFQNVQYLRVRFNLARHSFRFLLGEIAKSNFSNIQTIRLLVREGAQFSSFEFMDASDFENDYWLETEFLARYGWKVESPSWDPSSRKCMFEYTSKYVRIVR